jgi:hypothetical protein
MFSLKTGVKTALDAGFSQQLLRFSGSPDSAARD